MKLKEFNMRKINSELLSYYDVWKFHKLNNLQMLETKTIWHLHYVN